MKDQAYELSVRGNLVLPGGRIVNNGVLAINQGSIAAILEDGEPFDSYNHQDFAGMWIVPGAIDAHVHCFSEPSEGISGATRSAAAGGVTTIIDMPYDSDEPVWTAELLERKAERIGKEAFVDVALLATIRPDGDMGEIARLTEAGACGFKLSTFNTNPYRFPRINDGEMLEAFEHIAAQKRAVGLHAENDEIVRRLSRKHEAGDVHHDPLLHCKSRPPVAESTAVATALELAYWSGAHVHFHHTTVPHAVRLAESYAREGVAVSVETCIHYLVLTDRDMMRMGAKAKINPPLRALADQSELWEQCRNGAIGLVTSDHAPWKIEKKSASNIFDNASGAPGVETLVPLLYAFGVAEGRLSIHDLVRLVSENPARVYGLSDRKGALKIGADADFIAIDPAARWMLDENDQHSNAGWSLYHGLEMKGRIGASYVRGHEVYDGKSVSDKCIGQFVKPDHVSYLPLKPYKEAKSNDSVVIEAK